jgi:hypothetical protein
MEGLNVAKAVLKNKTALEQNLTAVFCCNKAIQFIVSYSTKPCKAQHPLQPI